MKNTKYAINKKNQSKHTLQCFYASVLSGGKFLVMLNLEPPVVGLKMNVTVWF